MNRIAISLAYEGTSFSGYAVQPHMRTVQGEVESALMKIHKGEIIRVVAAGRTDTGVHAKEQVLHFDSPLVLETSQWSKALNSCLPADIRVMAVAHVAATFHARYDAHVRHYRYRVLATRSEDVFRRNVTYHVPYSIDIEAMQKAAKQLVGTYDFTSFCVANTAVQDRTRTLYELSIQSVQDEIVFIVAGNGFLHNMVRIIVGTLLDIGTGKREEGDIIEIRDAKNRIYAGKTAPGHGLFLWGVDYETTLF